MLIFCLFSAWNRLLADGGILFFLLFLARKYLTLPQALQYLMYQIMLTIIIMTTVPSTVIITNNKLGIMKGYFSSISSKTFFTCWNETLFNSNIFNPSLSNMSFERGVILEVCISVKSPNVSHLLSNSMHLMLRFWECASIVNSFEGEKNESELASQEFGKCVMWKGCL